jgi:hypothetical protein
MIRTYIKETIAFQVNDLMNLKIKTDGSHIYIVLLLSIILFNDLFVDATHFQSHIFPLNGIHFLLTFIT